jgi:hypothetical protein
VQRVCPIFTDRRGEHDASLLVVLTEYCWRGDAHINIMRIPTMSQTIRVCDTVLGQQRRQHKRTSFFMELSEHRHNLRGENSMFDFGLGWELLFL